jgi:hypothetical protein
MQTEMLQRKNNVNAILGTAVSPIGRAPAAAKPPAGLEKE